MTTIADRYRCLADAFTAKVAAVPADRWDDASPCAGWSASDVVQHVTDTQGMFLGFIGRSVGDTPTDADDRMVAWTTARDAVQAALDDRASATTKFQGFLGETTFEEAVDRFLSFDLVIHGWDLARAAGLDERIDPAEVERLAAQAPEFGDAARTPNVFGPELDPPPGADAQAKLLAFLGRRV